MSEGTLKRNPPGYPDDNLCTCFYCNRKRMRLWAEYQRNNPRLNDNHYPVPYAHPAFAHIGSSDR